MNALSLIMMVISCLIKYGPTLWKLGKQVYEVVEQIIADWKAKHPEAAPEEVKAVADAVFDSKLVELSTEAGRRVPAPATRTQLRRDVWTTRAENYKKIKSGVIGMRPH